MGKILNWHILITLHMRSHFSNTNLYYGPQAMEWVIYTFNSRALNVFHCSPSDLCVRNTYDTSFIHHSAACQWENAVSGFTMLLCWRLSNLFRLVARDTEEAAHFPSRCLCLAHPLFLISLCSNQDSRGKQLITMVHRHIILLKMSTVCSVNSCKK